MIKIFLLFLIVTVTGLIATKSNENDSIENIKTKAPRFTEDVFNFTVNHTNSGNPCLMARFSVSFYITYSAKLNETSILKTGTLNLTQPKDFYGKCDLSNNSLVIEFGQNNILYLNYHNDSREYYLNSVKLDYDLSYFDDAIEMGNQVAEKNNINEFGVLVGKSFKCYSKTKFELDKNVTIEFRNYQAQAFIKNDTRTVGFDTAVECVADIVGSNKLVPIVIGIVLTVLIVLVLVAYIVGRRRYRPTYQQV